MSGKCQTVWDFTVSRQSQILPTNENSKSYISPIVWDERGQIWRIGSVSIFPTRPRFCDCRRSFPTNENSNLYRRGRRRPSAMDFAHYQSPKLLGASPPITNKRIVSRKSGTDLWRISDISAKSGIVGKK